MSIVADKIAAHAVTLEKLDFTPVQTSNVVASINASAEGLTINTAKLNLTGVLQVGGAAADINAGTTTINGGKIQTDTLVAGSITADKITLDGVRLDAHWVDGSRAATGTVYRSSSSQGSAGGVLQACGIASTSTTVVNGHTGIVINWASGVFDDANYSLSISQWDYYGGTMLETRFRFYLASKSASSVVLTLIGYDGVYLHPGNYLWAFEVVAMRRRLAA